MLRWQRWILRLLTTITPGTMIGASWINIASPMHLHGWQQLPLANFPHIRRWMFDHIEALPCWENTWIGEGFTTQKADA